MKKLVNSRQCLITQGFTLRQTNIAKGFACILLLIHHLFTTPDTAYMYTPTFYILGDPVEEFFGMMCKVCVAIYLFLSGYGVNESLSKKRGETERSFITTLRSSLRLLWKLWAGYIIIYLLFTPLQGCFRSYPYTSFSDVFVDFLGLAYLFGTPTINETWWYMSLAIISYLIAPFFKLLIEKTKALSFIVAFACFAAFYYFGRFFQCYIFMFGMLASDIKIFDYFGKIKCRTTYKWITSLAFVSLAAILRAGSIVWAELIFAFSIILFTYICISPTKCLSPAFEYIGKHSANIFMFHTFLFLYNFKAIVYAPKYSLFIVIAFVAECILLSIVIEFIKKISLVQKAIDVVGVAIRGKCRA